MPQQALIPHEKSPGEVDQSYGGLVEGVHLAGYSLERALRKLEWLLEHDRWKTVGTGYDDINEFLDTIKLDSFKVVVIERKKIAARIKELQPGASNRQIAKVLGVDETTVRRDSAANAASADKKKNNPKADGAAPAANAASVSGAAAAKIVESKEHKEGGKDAKQEFHSEQTAGGCTVKTLEELVASGRRFTTFYVDPPWQYDNQGTRGSTDNHYGTMTVDQNLRAAGQAARRRRCSTAPLGAKWLPFRVPEDL